MKRRVWYINLGPDAVALFADAELCGGQFDLGRREITVGVGDELWEESVDTLMHEAFEYAAAQLGVRWLPAGSVTRSHDGFLFVFTHPQFSELCARAAQFVTPALPVLSKQWADARKKRK